MKQFIRVFVPILLLLLLGYAIYYIFNQKKQVEETKNLLTQYEQKVVDTEADNAKLVKNVSRLSDKNVVLQDSISILRKRVLELKSLLRDKIGVIEGNNGEIARMKSEVQNLLNQITTLRNEKNSDSARIQQLDNERFALDKRIGELYMQNDTLETENNVLLVELVQTEKEKEDVQGQLEVTESTLAGVTGEGPYEVEGKKGVRLNINAMDAEFNVVEARTRRDKLARSVKRWKDTRIEFNLIYPEIGNLLKQNFSLQMLDNDTGKIISPRESNGGAYDTKGVEFAFTGNPVRIDFVNYQDKKGMGTNYTVQLYFIDGAGKEIALASASAPVIFKR